MDQDQADLQKGPVIARCRRNQRGPWPVDSRGARALGKASGAVGGSRPNEGSTNLLTNVLNAAGSEKEKEFQGTANSAPPNGEAFLDRRPTNLKPPSHCISHSFWFCPLISISHFFFCPGTCVVGVCLVPPADHQPAVHLIVISSLRIGRTDRARLVRGLHLPLNEGG